METKKQIRTRILNLRDTLSAAERTEKSRVIYEKVVSHPLFLLSDEIYCYIDFRSEVETRQILLRAWELGKKTAVPKVMGSEMDFFYIEHLTQLKKGYMGIEEPTTSIAAHGKNVLLIMPGAAFDTSCSRIGYGGGYYDKYISRHSLFHRIAIAFSLQMEECLPSEPFDQKPEFIITEDAVYTP